MLSIVRRFPQRKVVVVGDAIADRFLYGSIARVSREAPVFILRHEQTQTIPGGAANCAVNLAELGAHVSLIAASGDDEAGRELRAKLDNSNVDSKGLISCSELKTTTKVRILAGQVHSTRQQVIRIDYEDAPLSDGKVRQTLNAALEKAVSEADAVIISDYNYGVVDESVLNLLRVSAKRRIPVLVDSRFGLASFSGFTSATPNEDEVENLLGEKIESASQLEKSGEALRHKLDYKALLVTRGSQGMMLLENGVAPLHIKAVGAESPVDVTGAGDTVIATFTLALCL